MHGLCYSLANSGAAGRRVFAALLLVIPFTVHGADAFTSQQKEDFLTKAKIGRTKESKKGVTGTSQVTLSDGTITHDASVQTIDESKQFFLGEVGFKDTYKFNIAGWKLAKLLGIEDMVPVSVKRNYNGMPASFTWWVDNVVMDEQDRRAKNKQAPDLDAWNGANNMLQVFDQLIYNMDRNLTNMLIDQDWHLWLIDHGRAFRTQTTLKDASVLKTVDRNMLARMKMLDQETLTKELSKELSKKEIEGLLARRDLIVKAFEAKGDGALFDRPKKN